MADSFAGMKLRCRDGHWEWADFVLRPVPAAPAASPDGSSGGGYYMMVDCDFGPFRGHWLAADPDADSASAERVVVLGEPYVWPSATAAFAALDRYRAQQSQRT